MRSAFTMIELVFVIVILGILASVAIPKLVATRDDAEVAAGIQRVSSLITDLGSYYTSHGKFDNNVSLMTNEQLVDSAKALFSGNINTTPAYFSNTAKTKICLKVVVDDANGTLNIAAASDGSSYCNALITGLGSMIGVHRFGGSVIYN